MPRFVFAVVSSLAVLACGEARGPSSPARPAPADARDVRVSLFDVDCAECADKVVTELKKDGPVYGSAFDKKHVVLDVTVAPAITPERVVAAAERAGFHATVGAGGGSYAKQADAPPGADVSTVLDDGHDLASLTSVTVPGKITIVDFYAEWCGPCREVDKHVKDLLAKRPDLAYRRLDVVDWDSPIAAHYMKKVPTLPYVLVFDGRGAQIDAMTGLDLPRLDAAIAKARP
jgi:thiol-disulfide isomerase/thioredoxin